MLFQGRPDGGECWPRSRGAWPLAGRGDSLRVSGDGIRRDRAGLLSGIISGGTKSTSCPSKTCLSYLLLLGIPQVKFLSLKSIEALLKMKKLQERV